MRIFLMIVFCSLMLSACSLTKPLPAKDIKNYAIIADKKGTVRLKVKKQGKILLVNNLTAGEAYASRKIAYSMSPYQIAYYADHRWAAEPTQMMQTLVVQSLQNTGRFKTVASPPFTADADYRLRIKLVQLLQKFDQPQSHVEMLIDADLIAVKTQQVVASQRFAFNQPAPSNNAYGGAVATNHAMSHFLSQLDRFVLANS